MLRCLQVWYKQYNATHWDYATLASPASVAWAKSNGYTLQFTTGFVLPGGANSTTATGSSGQLLEAKQRRV